MITTEDTLDRQSQIVVCSSSSSRAIGDESKHYRLMITCVISPPRLNSAPLIYLLLSEGSLLDCHFQCYT